MIGEWIEIRDIFKLLDTSAERTIGHSTIFVVAKPDDHLYYLESFTKTICTEYPCRYILIKEEESGTREFLKAKLTYLETVKGSNRFCEFIEIEFTTNQKERLATTLTKFALPKLDVFLVLWQKNQEHKPFFNALKNITTRIIFDSEYTENPYDVLDLIRKVPKRTTVGDLSYTRAYSIREILIKELTGPQLTAVIDKFHTLKIHYNPCIWRCTDTPIQSIYLAQWLAMWGKMSPLFKLRHKNMTTIVYQHAKAIIQEGEIVKDLGEGKITELELIGPTHSFLLKRDTQNPGKIFTSIKSQESCSVPASFNTDDLNIGHSLMRQLQYDQTNQIQVDALEQIAQAPFKNVFSFPNLEETLHELKNKLLYIARDAIKQNNVFRIALSGGKTPMSLYRSFKREDLDWSKILIFFSDERQVSPDDNDSNYKNAMDALQHLQLHPKNIFRIQAESNQDANCYTYDRLIRPYLDVCLLGMGADGHTLSIFPNSPVLQESNRLVVPAPGPNHARVTFTFEALKICKHKIFLITGEEKKQMLETILQQMDPQHPASLVTDVDIYTDIKL